MLLVALMCCVAASLPDAEYGMTTADCRNCHDDAQGDTFAMHHVSCVDWGGHGDPLDGEWVDFRNCCGCHQISTIMAMLMVDAQIATMISNNEKVNTNLKREIRWNSTLGIIF